MQRFGWGIGGARAVVKQENPETGIRQQFEVASDQVGEAVLSVETIFGSRAFLEGETMTIH